MSPKKTKSRSAAKPEKKKETQSPPAPTETQQRAAETKPVERYFSLVVDRRFSEAEKELEDIRIKTPSSDWNRGYLKALEGIYSSKRTNDDRYSEMSKLDSDPKLAQHMKRLIRVQLQNPLHADYDRGYFTGLLEYVRLIQKLEPWNKTPEPSA